MVSKGDLLSFICDNLFTRSTNSHGDDRGPPVRTRARTHSLSASEDSADDDPLPLGDTQPEADALTVNASDDEVDALLARPPFGNTDVKQSQDDLLGELEVVFDDGDKKGPNIHQKLDEIVKNKWARKTSPKKVSEIPKSGQICTTTKLPRYRCSARQP